MAALLGNCTAKAFSNNRPDTYRYLANDATSTSNLFLIGDIFKQKKTKCKELSVLKTMQEIMRNACAAVLVKQLKRSVVREGLGTAD